MCLRVTRLRGILDYRGIWDYMYQTHPKSYFPTVPILRMDLSRANPPSRLHKAEAYPPLASRTPTRSQSPVQARSGAAMVAAAHKKKSNPLGTTSVGLAACAQRSPGPTHVRRRPQFSTDLVVQVPHGSEALPPHVLPNSPNQQILNRFPKSPIHSPFPLSTEQLSEEKHTTHLTWGQRAARGS